MHALFRRADVALSKMMDALADLLLVHSRSAAAACLTSGDLINPHYCGTESRDVVQMIFEIFPYRTHTWVHVENKSNDLSERRNRRAPAVACEEVCC